MQVKVQKMCVTLWSKSGE